MAKNKNIQTLDSFVDENYGKVGTLNRDALEIGFESFKIGTMIRQARKAANMTQEDLAKKAKTKRTYISRIERNESDIQLSTLQRIIELGFGGKLNLEIKI